MFSAGPKYQKLTTNLRLAINRLKLLEKKKTELTVKARREISEYLAAGKEDRARIRVEHIIREDYVVEAMELVEMYCDLLLARMGLIQSTKELDEGLEEPIATLFWAAPRLQAEVPELKIVADQLTLKYSKEFALCCRSNTLDNVNEKVMHKLGVQAPPKRLVDKYLDAIAKTYNVPFEPEPDAEEAGEEFGGGEGGGGLIDFSEPGPPMQPNEEKKETFMYPPPTTSQPPPPAAYIPPTGGVPMPGMTPIGFNPPPPPVGFSLPPPGYGSTAPGNMNGAHIDLPELPSVPSNSMPGNTSVGSDVDFDDLTKRFEELKKRK
ncbi:IST1-like protein [Lamellibrachia satsuma]|nr:IST1-like protein [Lamellibrachia satsuma]